MAVKHLTDRSVKSLKTSSTKGREDHWDGVVKGLVLRVTAQGSRTYCVVYRNRQRQRRRLLLGDATFLSLSEARSRAKTILGQVANGDDPAQKKEDYRSAETFGELCDIFLRLHATPNMRPRSIGEARQKIERILRPRWGHWKACDIRRRDVIQLLDEIGVERETPVYANRVRGLLSSIFTFGLRREIIDTSPCVGLPEKFPEEPRDRFFTDEEIILFWRATGKEEPVIRDLFRLLLLLGQRPGEMMAMAWAQLRNDIWYLPSTLTKNGKEHAVPLPALVQEILDARRENGQPYVFVARGEQPIQWIQKAKRRIAKRMEEILREQLELRGKAAVPSMADPTEGIPHWRVYDLRRTCATGIERLGVPEAVLSSVLNHSKASRQGVTAVYARHHYLEEKRVALDTWCRYVFGLISKTIEKANSASEETDFSPSAIATMSRPEGDQRI